MRGNELQRSQQASVGSKTRSAGRVPVVPAVLEALRYKPF